MKNWRPDGWKNPYNLIGDNLAHPAYEAGADMLLTCLLRVGIPPEVYADFLRWGLERGMENKTNRLDKVATYKGKKGTLVFIPEVGE